MKFRLIITACVVMFSSTAHTDDTQIYESFAGVKIGRVFLSQSERELLDERRRRTPVDASIDIPAARDAVSRL